MKSGWGTSISNIVRARKRRYEDISNIPEEPNVEEVQKWYLDVLGFSCSCCKN